MQLRAVFILAVCAHAHSKLLQLSCKDIRRFVNGHNQKRLEVARGNVPGQPGAAKMNYMVWDAELANKAAGWASKYRQGHNPNKDIASNRFQTGENLYRYSTTKSPSTLSIGRAIDSWFLEHHNYTFQPFKSAEPNSPKIGHYTQMVWSDTTYVGCAMSRWQDGKYTRYFVVCNYGPPGNYLNKFPYESSGKGSQKLTCSVGKDKCNTLRYGDSCPRH